ncbi:MAG: hypothetical protein OXS32_12540, partial [Verrucomicrobiales bacterium]|nr:hypothetical protein [Verrucomicrobiales bacterium]
GRWFVVFGELHALPTCAWPSGVVIFQTWLRRVGGVLTWPPRNPGFLPDPHPGILVNMTYRDTLAAFAALALATTSALGQAGDGKDKKGT